MITKSKSDLGHHVSCMLEFTPLQGNTSPQNPIEHHLAPAGMLYVSMVSCVAKYGWAPYNIQNFLWQSQQCSIQDPVHAVAGLSSCKICHHHILGIRCFLQHAIRLASRFFLVYHPLQTCVQPDTRLTHWHPLSMQVCASRPSFSTASFADGLVKFCSYTLSASV